MSDIEQIVILVSVEDVNIFMDILSDFSFDFLKTGDNFK